MALNSTVSEKFRGAFKHKCFRLIIEAYQTSLTEKATSSDWNENDISSELHRRINQNPLRTKWKISTNTEAPVPKDIPKAKGFADKFPRIDFRLTSFMSADECEYFFEAKNLKQNDSALKRRYISTGIDSFISKKYPNGNLLGYLLEGKADETVKGINLLLQKDKRNAEFLIKQPFKLHNEYYESAHENIGVLKHLLLDFST
ncbi:MAG: hypothetical protein CRN43_00255 [Candidatus Nephrothrix sp. EaCA]|nr:MAG: hypothetical protein CRN43_00255 [Candidatus Nephrothrix sp. EaCA]